MSPELRKYEKRKAAQRKMVLNNIRRVVIIMAVVIAISATIAFFVISCVNDILAIHVSPKRDVEVSVVITENMGTDDVIDALSDAGVINNAWFCKLAAKIIGYSDEGYIPRTYDFKPSMGLENMLNEIKDKTSDTAKTVTLTFPEGYTVDQIIAMLVENNVCSRENFISAMTATDFSKDFDFLESLTKVESRYMLLEGFLFPDTYEFYIGEDPESVIKKFLGNFDRKWTDSYSELAEARGMTVDQIIKLASIVEKEAVGADMPVVGSILFNRIDANMRLECDSTSIYMRNNLAGLSEEDIAAYDALYDTYSCYSLPVGAICNPGIDAIDAVLNAPDTGYYYFIHDRNNEFHVAKSLSEQEYNIRTYGLAQ
ncbi:MAG: endolytic transglycosylase MltG [Clostridia bacterium]|nr:endolytic transglycosylase MltG [Clostridia bacterium]